MFRRILIATDGSELSTKAEDSGIALAKALGADVVAYTAVIRAYYDSTGVLAPQDIARIDSAAQEQAKAVVRAAQAKALSLGLNATTLVGHDPVAEGIISAAQEHKCDLIVMASHGRKGLSRMLLGSETLDVLTHTGIPVLVLR